MTRFHFHLGLLSPSPLFHCASVDGADDEVVDRQSEADSSDDLISSPLIATAAEEGGCDGRDGQGQQLSILDTVSAALRKSLVMCSHGVAEKVLEASIDIGRPTDVQHISHVTFDRFDGFLGLPLEFQPEIPSEVPSASVSVFGVSAESMQCSHDNRGNSVPTILLSMQRHLYSQGGLKAEGIFRINGENVKEMLVREHLNKGIVPHGVDLHCLAGLIKAWFRELPSGVLDSLTAEQVMHCNTEEDCHQLVMVLPPTEAALLDWAINLMSDVVEHELYSKMNARNVALVFAPNMTQLVLLVWSYFMVVFHDPGDVPVGWQPASKKICFGLDDSAILADHTGNGTSEIEFSLTEGSERRRSTRYCSHCQNNKPPRCHHCSVCQRCVLKMDHHCIWVVNCVGARNYKFFLLFLFYTFLETVLNSLALLPHFIKFFGDARSHSGSPGDLAVIFLSFVLNVAFALSLLCFVIMHISLVLSNTTTIEVHEKKDVIEWKYDLGKRKNIEQVFGTKKMFWFFPLFSKSDLCNIPALRGLDFPIRAELEV